MTALEALHDFFGQMTYGYDKGVTQMWVTPSMYTRLYLAIQNVPLYSMSPAGGLMRDNWDVSTPTFIEFEGVRIYPDETK